MLQKSELRKNQNHTKENELNMYEKLLEEKLENLVNSKKFLKFNFLKKYIYIKKKLHPPHLGKGGGMYIYVWVVVLQAKKASPFSEMGTTAHPKPVPRHPKIYSVCHE